MSKFKCLTYQDLFNGKFGKCQDCGEPLIPEESNGGLCLPCEDNRRFEKMTRCEKIYRLLAEATFANQVYRWEGNYRGLDGEAIEMVISTLASLYRRGSKKVQNFIDKISNSNDEFDKFVKSLAKKDRTANDVINDIEKEVS